MLIIVICVVLQKFDVVEFRIIIVVCVCFIYYPAFVIIILIIIIWFLARKQPNNCPRVFMFGFCLVAYEPLTLAHPIFDLSFVYNNHLFRLNNFFLQFNNLVFLLSICVRINHGYLLICCNYKGVKERMHFHW